MKVSDVSSDRWGVEISPVFLFFGVGEGLLVNILTRDESSSENCLQTNQYVGLGFFGLFFWFFNSCRLLNEMK